MGCQCLCVFGILVGTFVVVSDTSRDADNFTKLTIRMATYQSSDPSQLDSVEMLILTGIMLNIINTRVKINN